MWRILALCAAMVSMAMAQDVLWQQYKEKYGLSFDDKEDNKRLEAFKDNLKFINEHNIDADLGKHTFRLGINKFAHMTNEEYRSKVIGNCLLGRNVTKSTGGNVYKKDPNLTDPDTVDWRSQGAVTAVKNQGECGSCWSFSATGAMEGAYFRSSGQLKSFSEQDLMDCGWGTAGVACAGGNPYAALQFVMNRGGACLESEYPYEGVQGICRYDNNPLWNPKQHILPISNAGKVAKGNEADLKSAVARYGPVSVGIDARHRSFQLYNGGVYRDPECSDIYLNHAVLAVGYGTEGQDKYWIVKNDEGEEWGDGGYIKMAREDGNMCGVATDPTWAQ